MKKIIILTVLFLIFPLLGKAEIYFFPYYNSLFTAPLIFTRENYINSHFESQEDSQENFLDIIQEDAELEILISKRGFNPAIINASVGEKIVWKNERARTSALLLGVREARDLNSGLLMPGENFSYTFSEPGTYIYVDGVVIGYSGKIVVK